MNKIILSILIVAASLNMHAQDKWNKEPFMVKQLGSERFSSAEVSTSGGSISVTGVKAAEARVEVFIFFHPKQIKQ